MISLPTLDSSEYLLALLLGLAFSLARLGLALAIRRIRLRGGWATLGRALAALIGMGLLWLGITQGWLAAPAAGLGWPGRMFAAGRLPFILALGAGWLMVLWGGVWRAPRQPLGQATGWGTLGELPAHALGREAGLALLRAAAIPLLGAVWGPWLGCASLIASDIPHLHGASPEHFAWRMLAWALDALSTGLYVVSGSLWPGLIARILLTGLMAGMYARAQRRTRLLPAE